MPAFTAASSVSGVHEARAGHLQVEAVVGRGHAVISGVPVGHENSLKTPLALEHFEVEKIVLRGVDSVDQVVGIHHRVHMALSDGSLKGRQIDFAHGALVHVRADVVPVVLLAVHGVVLDGGDYALGLDALNERDHQGGVEKRILGKIFEVAPGQRRARDVDTGSEQKMHTAGAGIPAQGFADSARQRRIPTGGQRHSAGISGGRTPGAHADRRVRHLEARQVDRRHGLREHLVDAAQQHNLLFERETGYQGVSSGLNLRRVRRGRLGECGERAARKQREKAGDGQRRQTIV